MSAPPSGRRVPHAVAVGVVALAVAAVYFVLVSALPESQLADSVGPAGLPRTYAVVLAILAVLLIGQGALNRAAGSGEPSSPPGRTPPPWRALAMVLAGLVYVVAVPRLGYVLTVSLLLAAAIAIQGGALTRRAWLIAAGGAVLFWGLFVWLLRVPQPAGWWTLLR
ncbi:MAG: tripartite tricarboxylate transporter TctB family protein [Vicinamibacterales bacterium]